mmetsp:Transcript_15075/g.23698  ORF Transcript_15075/g.23698 Transcript_15075/m.23698 type:complete len:198 (-) Transcript_15075:93-686(-)
MELHGEIVKGLEVLASFDDNLFCPLVEASFSIVLKHVDETALQGNKFQAAEPLKIKQAHAAAVGVILEAGKRNADPIFMRGVLSDYLKNTTKVDFFVEQYTIHKRELIAVLSTTGFNFPHIIDVNWRLTFHMKSQSIEKENKPVYLLRFDTKTPGKTPIDSENTNESVEFACNGWELLDLVQKLKDAAKQFDRVTSQ